MPRKTPSVVLVGRPNVGKSTLFNRITGSRRAIVAPIAGTTRDSLARPAVWRGSSFQLFDTGGLFGASEDPLHELVVRQGQRAIVGADLLVLVVDGREGLASGDETIARELRETGLPVLLAINKTDDKRSRDSLLEFYQLGFEPVIEISAEHGTGVAELLDEIVKRIGGPKLEDGTPGSANEDGDPPPVPAASSRPRTRPPSPSSAVRTSGKSSLVNRLLHEERVLVSEMPGTTRDAIDTVLLWHRRRFRIVDTAGMRRPGRVSGGGQVEMVSVAGAKKAIFDADVVALVIDASTGATDQDAAIGGEADRAGRGIVIIANKWDLVKSRDVRFLEDVRRESAPRDAISRLRADPAHLGADRRARAEGARDDRQDCGDPAQAHSDARPQQVHRGHHGRESAGQPRPQARAHHVRGADRRRAALVRVLHQRGHDVSFLLRALPHQPASRELWIRRDAHPAPGPPPCGEEATT